MLSLRFLVAISRAPPGDHHGDLPSLFRPAISDLQILSTTPSSLTLSALINMTNPTPYGATIPYIDLHILSNGSLLAHTTAKDLRIHPGTNSHLLVKAVWDPLSLSGKAAQSASRELLSRYLSGYNTTLTLQTHSGSIPALPGLGEALSKFAVDIPTPELGSGGGNDERDGDGSFIEDATMHLFSSTADFTLFSPLQKQILFVTSINATAYYPRPKQNDPGFPSDPDDDDDDDDDWSIVSRRNMLESPPRDPSDPSDLGDEVGHIMYDLPFAVPPVDKDGNGITTPRLPVEWKLGGVGYEAVRRALGGKLKVGAFAYVGVKIGKWEEKVWFRGKGIGASVRL